MSAAVPKKQDAIESVYLSPDEKALMVSLVHQDPEVVAFAKSGGLGEDPTESVAAAKRIFKIGVLSTATGSALATVSELHRVVAQMDALAAMPQQVANQLGETVGKELDRMVGDDERPGALSAALDSVTAEAAKSLAKAVKPIQDALLGSGATALPQVLEVRLQETLNRGTREALDRMFDVKGSPLMVHLANGEKAITALRQETAAIEERLRGQISALSEKVVAQDANTPTPVQAGNTWEPTSSTRSPGSPRSSATPSSRLAPRPDTGAARPATMSCTCATTTSKASVSRSSAAPGPRVRSRWGSCARWWTTERPTPGFCWPRHPRRSPATPRRKGSGSTSPSGSWCCTTTTLGSPSSCW
jgi:hypothetical protein